ncbi:MAG: branched-chain amino acid transaminase [Nitrospira sp.]|nr:branched-chain amino acid transaminase [Nitrospira sp.]MCB9709801.1 branched-chain amino acid transaminase [Nitrospiraceae bacterium]MDR4486037.1 branched-chain amino acid transaminase [Nitrospirales bacterium]MCA9464022.1 branched-chain amino acid transaminase [Nitrospira sp.]MCA9474804.1 branched-chain amino acid transaminase [Nitrospira sp.]
MVKASKKIWMDGALVDWDDATVHVLTHSLHYGLAPFEGIRCYQGAKGSAIFRLKEHVDRLFESAHIMMMPMPFSKKVVMDAIVETVRVNQLESCYIRPIAFIGYGAMGVYPGDNPIRLAIAAWPWGSYLGEDALSQGIRAKISSFTRHHVNVSMTRAKVSGYYVNSILAKWEAKKSGYAECILLDPDGYVAEGTGENVFIVSKGVLRTTPLTSILDGITRNSILQLAKAKNIPVVEERFTRDAMYVADEIFLTGTAAEVTPVRELDDRIIGEGKPGPVTLALQNDFFKIVRGEDWDYSNWLTPV